MAGSWTAPSNPSGAAKLQDCSTRAFAAESNRSAKEARLLLPTAGTDDDADDDDDEEDEEDEEDEDDEEDDEDEAEAVALPLLLHKLQLSTDITGSVAKVPEAARLLQRARCCG